MFNKQLQHLKTFENEEQALRPETPVGCDTPKYSSMEQGPVTPKIPRTPTYVSASLQKRATSSFKKVWVGVVALCVLLGLLLGAAIAIAIVIGCHTESSNRSSSTSKNSATASMSEKLQGEQVNLIELIPHREIAPRADAVLSAHGEVNIATAPHDGTTGINPQFGEVMQTSCSSIDKDGKLSETYCKGAKDRSGVNAPRAVWSDPQRGAVTCNKWLASNESAYKGNDLPGLPYPVSGQDPQSQCQYFCAPDVDNLADAGLVLECLDPQADIHGENNEFGFSYSYTNKDGNLTYQGFLMQYTKVAKHYTITNVSDLGDRDKFPGIVNMEKNASPFNYYITLNQDILPSCYLLTADSNRYPPNAFDKDGEKVVQVGTGAAITEFVCVTRDDFKFEDFARVEAGPVYAAGPVKGGDRATVTLQLSLSKTVLLPADVN